MSYTIGLRSLGCVPVPKADRDTTWKAAFGLSWKAGTRQTSKSRVAISTAAVVKVPAATRSAEDSSASASCAGGEDAGGRWLVVTSEIGKTVSRPTPSMKTTHTHIAMPDALCPQGQSPSSVQCKQSRNARYVCMYAHTTVFHGTYLSPSSATEQLEATRPSWSEVARLFRLSRVLAHY